MLLSGRRCLQQIVSDFIFFYLLFKFCESKTYVWELDLTRAFVRWKTPEATKLCLSFPRLYPWTMDMKMKIWQYNLLNSTADPRDHLGATTSVTVTTSSSKVNYETIFYLTVYRSKSTDGFQNVSDYSTVICMLLITPKIHIRCSRKKRIWKIYHLHIHSPRLSVNVPLYHPINLICCFSFVLRSINVCSASHRISYLDVTGARWPTNRLKYIPWFRNRPWGALPEIC